MKSFKKPVSDDESYNNRNIGKEVSSFVFSLVIFYFSM